MLPCSLQEGDHRWINSVARALQLLNSLYGPFSRAYGIGRCAKVGAAAGLTLPWPEVPTMRPGEAALAPAPAARCSPQQEQGAALPQALACFSLADVL